MNPFDAVALPFIERDFSTPYIDRAFERERQRQLRLKQQKQKEEAHHEILPDN